MEWVGGAAGGTLGFLFDNTRGAVRGWKLGRQFGKMAKRKRTGVDNRIVKKVRLTPPRVPLRRSVRTRRLRKRISPLRRGGSPIRRGGSNGSEGSGSSSVIIKGGRRFARMFKGFKQVLGPREVRSLTSTKLSYAVNRQGVYLINQFYDGTAVHASVLTKHDIDEMVKNLRQDDFEPAGYPDQWRTMKFFIPKVKTVSRLRNMGTAPVNMTIYTLVARRDQSTLSKNPLTAWGDGMVDAQSTTIGSNTMEPTDPGVTPFKSGQFTNLFKVKKVNEFTLHPGSTHKHYVTVYPNKMWTQDLTNTLDYYHNISSFILVVVKGDIGEATNIAEEVVYTPGLVEVVTEYKASVKTFMKNKRLNTWYTNLNTGLLVPVRQVVEDTDIVADVVTT